MLLDEELAARLDQIPLLAHPDRVVEELTGGLTNRNLKVTTPEGVYVARCSTESARLLGIDRDREHHNSLAAQVAGVGAPVVDYRPDVEIMVIGFIEGQSCVNADLQQPGILPRVAQACRQLHGGPAFEGEFDMFALQRQYLASVQEHGYRLPADYFDHADGFAEIARALAVRPPPSVPCNNDLLAGNLIDDGDRIWLIDYEYSGNNDACFELGNIWSECELSDEQLDELVTAYYGRRLGNKIARARLWGIAAKYGWTLWGCLQNGASPIDFDFWSWAMEKYDGAVAEMSAPGFRGLLDDVQRDD